MSNRPIKNWKQTPMTDVWTDIPDVATQDRINARRNKELKTTLAVVARKFMDKPEIIEFVSQMANGDEDHTWTPNLVDAHKVYYPVAVKHLPKTTDPEKVQYAILDYKKLKKVI